MAGCHEAGGGFRLGESGGGLGALQVQTSEQALRVWGTHREGRARAKVQRVGGSGDQAWDAPLLHSVTPAP